MNNSLNNKQNQQEGTKQVPSCVLRKCCACGKIVDRKELIRILTDHKTGKIIIEPNNKQFGRSQYICKDEGCLKIAIKKKRFKYLSDIEINILKDYIIEKS